MNLKQLLSAFSPQKAKQDEYKLRAKAKGLLSFQDLDFLLSNNSQSLQEILAENKDLKFTLDTKFDLEIPEGQTEFKLENKVIFDNKNFHNLNLSQDDLEYLASRFLEETKEVKLVLNVNHSQFPEDSIGYFENLEVKEGQILADICFTDLDNSKFQDQLRACKNGAEFGFSIEICFDSYSVSKKGEIKLSEPYLTGLATTLVPSAPATLTALASDKADTKDTKATDTKTADTKKILPTTKAKKPKKAKKAMAMAEELEIEDCVQWNLGDGNQVGEIIAILRNGELEIDSSEELITASETDPIAIIQIFDLVNDDQELYREGDNFTAHPFSMLTEVVEPNTVNNYYNENNQPKNQVNFDGQIQNNLNEEGLKLEIQSIKTENLETINELKENQKIFAENVKDLSQIVEIQNQTIQNYQEKLSNFSKSLSKSNKISPLL